MNDRAQGTGDEAPPRFMTVRQVADYLSLNEKKVYALVAEGKLPGTKITGKWMFPRELVDQWMVETSHGGVLTDRLVLAGSDDPLLYRAVMHLAAEIGGNALISYTSTGTRLGLSLLARHRADACGIHWGPVEESRNRHPGLIKHYPQHHDWVMVRVFLREQGLMVAPGAGVDHDPRALFHGSLRWAMRQEGAGSRRFLQEALARDGLEESLLRPALTAHSEREAAAALAMGLADVAPGVRAAATEFGLGFVHLGWEAFDLVLNRKIYFRHLFQRLMEHLAEPECEAIARDLGGYDFAEHGRLVWAE